jgi:predicted DCC family thiol-disulfide oxidoreductase YuxK
MLTRRGFDLAPLQSSWVTECLDIDAQDLLAALRVITLDGRAYAGADALLFLARRIWWAFPLTAFALIPGSRPLFRYLYAFWARHRCLGKCALADQSRYSSKAPIRPT